MISKFMFMSLPREIRDMIYRLALILPDNKRLIPAAFASGQVDKWCMGEDFAPNVNLMCTCKRVRAEAELIFFQHNTFVLHDSLLSNPPSCFSSPLADMLKSIEVQYKMLSCLASYHSGAAFAPNDQVPSLANTFHMPQDDDEAILKRWGQTTRFAAKLPALLDMTLYFKDVYVDNQLRKAMTFIICLSLILVRQRRRDGLNDCRLHVRGLMLQDFDYFVGACRPNIEQKMSMKHRYSMLPLLLDSTYTERLPRASLSVYQ